jgi:DNA topoisomerase-1
VRLAHSLVYSSDAEPGYTRRLSRGRFEYLKPSGARVTDARELLRIRKLVIPPAYTAVWICARANGHLQATGRDARGRKQYRYHPHWREARDASKYHRTVEFAGFLPKLRARVRADLRLKGMPRAKVIAAVVRLLEASLIRVGNEEYARTNGSFGLTTLNNHHVRVSGQRLRFRFRGKSGKFHDIQLDDARLARIVRRCQELPGQALFQYVGDDGETESISSGDVNDYIRETTSSDFSAKDFRTWAGSVLAAEALYRVGPARTQTIRKHRIATAIGEVSERLGNTPSVCRKCYVHPAVIEAYERGTLVLPSAEHIRAKTGLAPNERALLRMLRAYEREHGLMR